MKDERLMIVTCLFAGAVIMSVSGWMLYGG